MIYLSHNDFTGSAEKKYYKKEKQVVSLKKKNHTKVELILWIQITCAEKVLIVFTLHDS